MKKKLLLIFGNLINTSKKFPIAHLIAIFLTIIACIGVRHHDLFDSILLKYYLSGTIALLLSLYGPLRFEKTLEKKKNQITNIMMQLGAIIIGIIYYFIIQNVNFDKLSYSAGLSYFGLILVIIIGIFVLVAIRYKNNEKITRNTFKNIIYSVIFGGIVGLIIRGGISGALWSIESLFNLDISNNRYGYIGSISMIYMAISFCLDYYLIKDSNEKENKESQINKILGNYIFMPLALLYLVIFLLYGIKILVTGIRPKGVIVWLGLGFFALGMIAIFFTYLEENKIFKTFHKILFVGFLFMSIMMICAITQRIQQHGITMNRYFVCAGISVIILTSIFSLIFPRHRFISFVSILLIATIFSLYGGPIGAKQISLNSQIKELQNLLKTENLDLPLGKNSLSGLASSGVNTIARALEDMNNRYESKDWQKGIIDESGSLYDSYDLTYGYLGYNYYNDYSKEIRIERNLYDNKEGIPAIDVTDFKHMYPIGGTFYNVAYPSEDNKFELQIGNKKVILDLAPYTDMFYDAIKEGMEFPFTLEVGDYTYILTYIELIKSDIVTYTKIVGIGGYIFKK